MRAALMRISGSWPHNYAKRGLSSGQVVKNSSLYVFDSVMILLCNIGVYANVVPYFLVNILKASSL